MDAQEVERYLSSWLAMGPESQFNIWFLVAWEWATARTVAAIDPWMVTSPHDMTQSHFDPIFPSSRLPAEYVHVQAHCHLSLVSVCPKLPKGVRSISLQTSGDTSQSRDTADGVDTWASTPATTTSRQRQGCDEPYQHYEAAVPTFLASSRPEEGTMSEWRRV